MHGVMCQSVNTDHHTIHTTLHITKLLYTTLHDTIFDYTALHYARLRMKDVHMCRYGDPHHVSATIPISMSPVSQYSHHVTCHMSQVTGHGCRGVLLGVTGSFFGVTGSWEPGDDTSAWRRLLRPEFWSDIDDQRMIYMTWTITTLDLSDPYYPS